MSLAAVESIASKRTQKTTAREFLFPKWSSIDYHEGVVEQFERFFEVLFTTTTEGENWGYRRENASIDPNNGRTSFYTKAIFYFSIQEMLNIRFSIIHTNLWDERILKIFTIRKILWGSSIFQFTSEILIFWFYSIGSPQGVHSNVSQIESGFFITLLSLQKDGFIDC